MNLYNNYNIVNATYHDHPFIISIPHSGRIIPTDIKEKMNENLTLSGTDWFLTELYDFIQEMNITVIQNNLNRYVIDMNRKIDRNNTLNFRTNLVFQKTAFGKSIYKHDLSKRDIESRIKFYYEPYHTALDYLIKDKLKHYKKIYLLDMHSYFPEGDHKENIIISNQNNKTSSKNTLDLILNCFEKEGLKPKENELFLGGHITKYYGSKYKNKVESLQIEIPYNLYIENREFNDEEVNFYNEKLFLSARSKLQKVISHIICNLREL